MLVSQIRIALASLMVASLSALPVLAADQPAPPPIKTTPDAAPAPDAAPPAPAPKASHHHKHHKHHPKKKGDLPAPSPAGDLPPIKTNN